MTDFEQQLRDLRAELDDLNAERRASQAGLSTAMTAISCALREIPGYQPKVMEGLLIHSLKHGWPMAGVPDSETNETAYTAPLRFLLNEHSDTRDLIRKRLGEQE